MIYTIYMAEQLYCSVDLEFTGFDPAKDQILEIGFAFFKLSDKGFEVVEEWSQVFKPSIEVHPKILGLTGITQQELDEAPEFNEFREELQSKLGDAIIVGHNPVMDIKFLEGYGLKLSGKVIDTLELVQFILPTHHSYNLENLVHYFGIKHHKAHRALGDALSTILVLENLVRVYQRFNEQLKSELAAVIKRGKFLWTEILAVELLSKKSQSNDSLRSQANIKLTPLKLNKDLITIDDKADHHEARAALGLQKENQPSVIAVGSANTVMDLWKNGIAHGVFRSEDTFSEMAFKKFLNKAKTAEELRFCLKIIVWQHTNWQTEVVLDLNISFFGGQFRQNIVGGKPIVKTESVVAIDYATLQGFSLQGKASPVANRKLLICDIQNFEKYISTGFGTRLAWANVLYALRFIYNPETDFGNTKLKDDVVNALVATDLFFGLVFMLLHKAMPYNQYATVAELEKDHDQLHGRLKRAAENLRGKLQPVIKKAESPELERISQYLQNFFQQDTNRVKWVDIDEHNLAFHDQPIDIAIDVSSVLKAFQGFRFTETITNKKLLLYYIDRLGLHTESSEIPSNSLPASFAVIEDKEFSLNQEVLYKEVINSELPLVVTMPTLPLIKEFYNIYYPQIKKKAALFAQGYSGGGNKMFRNFSINKNSILLVTADFMGKQNYSIPAKTIIFAGLPMVEPNHPYTAALISYWKSKHPELESLLSFAKTTAALKKIKLGNKINLKIFSEGKISNFVDKSH